MAPTLKDHRKMWCKIPRLWHKNMHRPCMVVVFSWGPLVGCCQFLEASSRHIAVAPISLPKGPCRAKCTGKKGMGMPRALIMTAEKWFRTLKCRGIIWHTFVVPNFAIPKISRSVIHPCDRPRGPFSGAGAGQCSGTSHGHRCLSKAAQRSAGAPVYHAAFIGGRHRKRPPPPPPGRLNSPGRSTVRRAPQSVR